MDVEQSSLELNQRYESARAGRLTSTTDGLSGVRRPHVAQAHNQSNSLMF
jgi:hypothetical protein